MIAKTFLGQEDSLLIPQDTSQKTIIKLYEAPWDELPLHQTTCGKRPNYNSYFILLGIVTIVLAVIILLCRKTKTKKVK